MSARKKANEASRRERRALTDEFKRQAVQLMHERRAQGVTVTQVGRELNVRPDPAARVGETIGRRRGRACGGRDR
jgi:transposase-like protein